MKGRTIVLFFVIFVVTAMFRTQNTYANCEGEILVEQSDEVDLKTDAVLAYYDLETQTETLYTEEDIENAIGSVKKIRDIEPSTEPQSATEPNKVKSLTDDEIELFEQARENTLEGYEGIKNTMRAVDNRTLVSDPQADPYYRIAKLFFSKKTNAAGTTTANYMGTGFAIGYNLCATARHCLTDDYGNWVTNFKAYYGYNGISNTYCDLLKNVSGYIYYPQYVTGENSDGTIQTDADYDIAFVIWDEITVEETGCFGMSSAMSNGLSLITAGYPGDLDNGNRMYRATGSVTSFSDFRLVCNNIYCYPGQSGSAYYDSNLLAHGVITHTALDSSGAISGESSGRRFDTTLIQWLQSGGYA